MAVTHSRSPIAWIRLLMKIAVLSDIHSNVFALEATLKDVLLHMPDRFIFLGDIFGYYPWAAPTFGLLEPLIERSVFIRGNHDSLVLTDEAPFHVLPYWNAAQQNKEELEKQYPEALVWLNELPFERDVTIRDRRFHIVHGTPQDPLNGRFYPDNEEIFSWFPEKGEALLMGHTHYPLIRKTRLGGWIMNPGSVGQPRDGNPMPSWGLIDLDKHSLTLNRSNYNNAKAIEVLSAMKWAPRSIAALNKTTSGKM
jgi:putative phosphoesterase